MAVNESEPEEQGDISLSKELSEHSHPGNSSSSSSSSSSAPASADTPSGGVPISLADEISHRGGTQSAGDNAEVSERRSVPEMKADAHSFRSVATSAAMDEIVVRFMQPRHGIFFGDTNLGDVIVKDVDSRSEASEYLEPGLVLTSVAGKHLPRNIPAVAVHALLKQKSARPLMLSFSPHRRCADMLPSARLQRPTLANSSARKRTPGVRPRAGWQLCVQPGVRSNDRAPGIKRPAGVPKKDWLLAVDASDLLCRRRTFNR
jgi:hypothetical protein